MPRKPQTIIPASSKIHPEAIQTHHYVGSQPQWASEHDRLGQLGCSLIKLIRTKFSDNEVQSGKIVRCRKGKTKQGRVFSEQD
jgi:hypothetical protein